MPKFEMGPLIHRWMNKQVRRNMWRMPEWVSEEDLKQEGLFYWAKVNNRYHERVTEIRHMMALFMKSYERRITDLAKDIGNPRHETSTEVQDTWGWLETIAAEPETQQQVQDTIDAAPEPVRTILRLIMDPASGIFDRPYRTFINRARQDNPRTRLVRAARELGVDIEPNADPFKLVETYFYRTKRKRIYEEPTVLQVVAALVDARHVRQRHPTLRLRPRDASAARYRLAEDKKQRRYKRQPRKPYVEVHRRAYNHPQSGVRRRASHTQPQQQVQELARTQICARVHGNWRTCDYERPQQPGHDPGLRGAEGDHDGSHSGALGPRAAGVGERQGAATGRRRIGGRNGALNSQDGHPPLHPHGGGTGRVRIRQAGTHAGEL